MTCPLIQTKYKFFITDEDVSNDNYNETQLFSVCELCLIISPAFFPLNLLLFKVSSVS